MQNDTIAGVGRGLMLLTMVFCACVTNGVSAGEVPAHSPGYPANVEAGCPADAVVAFTDATYLYGNVNGAPDGHERIYCSCSVVIEDYNQDGYTDIFVGNHLLEDVMYHNYFGVFENIAPLIGLADPMGERAAEGAVFGDVDNDGDLDLYILSGNQDHDEKETPSALDDQHHKEAIPDTFFLNRQKETGRTIFEYATEWAGITVDTIPYGIAFLDINRDGWLDDYRQSHHGQVVYLNVGNGKVIDVTKEMGLEKKFDSDAMGIALADFDNDGDMDIFVGAGPEEESEEGKNVLLRNEKGRFFRDVAGDFHLDDKDSTFSATWGDYDNDGDMDLYLAKNGLYETPHRNTLYRNDGPCFTDVTDLLDVGDPEAVSTGAVFADFDNDGWLDLYVQNGTDLTGEGDPRDTLYRNPGHADGPFQDVTFEAGLGGEDRRGYALTVGDVNHDGFLDVYTGNTGGDLNQLWLNTSKDRGNTNHWIALKLVGRGARHGGSNVSAIGARVSLEAGHLRQMREIAPASPGNYHGLTVHFGLGKAKVAKHVVIRWPNGNVQKLRHALDADRIHTIMEESCD